MLITYLTILIALDLAPLAVVAPLRESAIVLVTRWGIWRLDERSGAVFRLAGASMIMLGVLLVVA